MNRSSALRLDWGEIVRREVYLIHISSNGYRSTSGRLKTWCGADRNLSVFLKSIHLLFGVFWCPRRDEIGATERGCYFFGGRLKDKHWTPSRFQFHVSNKSANNAWIGRYRYNFFLLMYCSDKINLRIPKN